MTVGTILCTATHPVDLHDGRSLGPGEWASGVDLADPVHAHLLSEGAVVVLPQAPAKVEAPVAASPPGIAKTPATPDAEETR